MIKKFNVKVNGKSYEVEVEEVSSQGTVPVQSVPVAAPVQKPAATPASAPTPKPAATPASAPTAGGHEVISPLPGAVVDILVSVGQSVSEGDKLIIIEAMKMENEIPAPVSGVIDKILVKKGDTVEGEQLLITIK
ncbi:acetyl-CoA carboxylase biotin carboxyl carrier protein subunit [Tepiditoga spiralis]|uniref:Acetyl-CoA carboxylase biotin carboxyl carrier protein subunit n=1 Tax=Tepiditoga spiralis TaxID=2108365 RepID=A0A7G1G7I4_9BACT|nr:biotin/lipoyl-containing protein [Tepiditoga spiralis]BBE31144.1 acetyl-CoA carboxylase biotin carboxyl carrier protein subunit [Tepiditoga spiralis]